MATLSIKFLATSIGMQMHLVVFLPDSIAAGAEATADGDVTERRLKVLWLLHGEGGDCSDWLRLSMVEHHAQQANIALVMPNLDNAMCMDMAHGGYPYFTYLTEDLPRHMRHLVPVLSDRREDNFVAGVSTGGYGAVKWALRAPAMFAGSASLSGDLDMVAALRRKASEGSLGDDWIAAFGDPSRLAGTSDDILHLISPDSTAPTLISSVYLASSQQEPGLAENRQVAARLEKLGVEVVVRTFSQERGWPMWDGALREIIGRIARPAGADGSDMVAS